MRQITAVLVLSLAAALCLVQGQQYIPIPIYIPTIINQSAPAYAGYGRPPSYNYSNSYNNSNGYNNGYNQYGQNNGYNQYGQNNGYRPPGSYGGNQFPRYNNSYNSSYNGSQDGHLFVGHVQLYDRLLFNQVYRKEARWWTNREKTVEYPAAAPAGYTRNEIISAIRIYNQFLDGNSARASIIKGGVGYQYVKIYLESKWNKGFQYLIQIYGH